MERMKTQLELLKECCDIKDEACVKYQKRIAELEEENKNLKDEVKDLVERNAELDKKYMLVLTENEKLKEWAEENSYLRAENRKLKMENKKLRIELSAYDREYFDEGKKAAFIFSDFGGYDEDVAN